MELFDEKLQHLQEEMARKQRLQKKLAELEAQKKSLEERAWQLKEVRDREQDDVDGLEGRSLTRFFLRITGKLDSRLTKEQQEAAEAAVRYDAVAKELEEVKRAISEIRLELNGKLYNIELVYEQTLRKKKEAVKASSDPRAPRILELEEQIGQLNVQMKELDEAIYAGNRALQIARSIQSSLESAENWGTWDLVGGSGLITHMAKHSHLDEAQARVESLQAALGRFRTELADVRICANMTVNIEGFARFADWFYDGIFADWAVLDRIKNSSDRVYEVQGRISDAVKKLERMKAGVEWKQKALKKEQEELLSQIPM